MVIHKDTRIKFEIKGRRYEAVGFLNEGEPSIDGYTMLARVAEENGGAIGEEDAGFLLEHLDQLPIKLWPYWLVTNRGRTDFPRDYVSCFHFSGYKWHRYWGQLYKPWFDYDLAVRRCP